MIKPIILIAAATVALGACESVPPERQRATDEQRLAAELGGRVAGKPMDCLPSYRQTNMVAVGERTLLYRDGDTIYKTDTGGGCGALSSPGYTLVTEQFGTGQLCRGTIARVVDLTNGNNLGSCVIGEFTPYRRP